MKNRLFDPASFNGTFPEPARRTAADDVVAGQNPSPREPAQSAPVFRQGADHAGRRAVPHADKLFSASGLIEGLVRDADGRRLGEIEDFMIDMTSGQIEYVVFSFGGVFGLGNRLCAVTPGMLEVDEENGCVRLGCHKEQLGNAPRFDKHKWPWMSRLAHPGNIYILCGKPPCRSESRYLS